MRKILVPGLVAAVTLALAVSLQSPVEAADHAAAGDITITAPWVRATPGGVKNGAAYATLSSAGAADRLVKVTSPAAGRVELHNHFMEDGVMKMRPVDGVAVPAGGNVAFAPGGYHIMLLDIGHPFRVGETVPLTFVFEKAAPISLDAPVEASAPAASEHHQH